MSPATESESNKSGSTEDIDVSEGDLGILDFAEIFEERFAEVNDLSARIATATETLGTKINERSAEINNLTRDSQGNTNRNSARRLISLAAKDMDQYTGQMKAITPLFGASLNTGMDAFLEYVRLSVDLRSPSSESGTALESVMELAQTMESSRQSMDKFRDTIFALPRMTSELNKAKRAAISILDEFVNELTKGQALLTEVETTLRDMSSS